MYCAISGEIPVEPVFSPTGYIFEKRLVLNYLKSSGNKCPISHADLNEDDLKPIQTNKTIYPRTVDQQSIPKLLQQLQSEWDVLILESFQLRQNLHTTRTQLSQTLYQHDAACRVIARLTQERDDAIKELHQYQQELSLHGTVTKSVPSKTGDKADTKMMIDSEEMDLTISNNLPNYLSKSIESLSTRLREERKARSKQSPPEVNPYTTLNTKYSLPIHSSNTPTINSIDFLSTSPKDEVILTAGEDRSLILFDLLTQKTLAKATNAHEKKITHAKLYNKGKNCVSACVDGQIKIWRIQDKSKIELIGTITTHTASINDLIIHPYETLCITASKNEGIMLHDLALGKTVATCNKSEMQEINSLAIQPDGVVLLAGGMEGDIYVIDINSLDIKATLKEHSSAITSLSMSDNGYLLLVTSKKDGASIVDLRKGTCVQKLEAEDGSIGAFDDTGRFFVLANGHYIQVYNKAQTKKEAVLEKTIENVHAGEVTDLVMKNNYVIIASQKNNAIAVWTD